MFNNLLHSHLPKVVNLGLKLFWSGMWLLGLGMLCWLPLRRWPGETLVPIQIFNYLMPWLLVGLLPGLAIALLGRRWALAATLAIPAAFIGINYAPLFLPRSNFVLAGSQDIKLMSYNIWRHNPNLSSSISAIQRENPDILLLQEATPAIVRQVQAEWQKSLPAGEQLYLVDDRWSQQATLSRYPLTPLGFGYEQGRALKTMVDTPAGQIEVWNVHTTQPIEREQQREEFRALVDGIAGVTGPLIVGGDFNTTDQSEMYRLINRQLSNAHWEAGWGFGFSFPAHGPTVKGVPLVTPMVRIDHIFYNHYFFAHSAGTLANVAGSDHLPIVAKLSLVAQ